MTMQALPSIIYDIRDKILSCMNVERIYLFGSYACGTPHKDSDFDFYIVLPDDCPFTRLDALHKIRRNIGHTHFIPVDLLANYKSRFEELSQLPTMMRQIARDGIVLYECTGTC